MRGLCRALAVVAAWSPSVGLAQILDSAEDGDDFGSQLAAGDFDGDGFADLVVSAIGESFEEDSEGAVHVLYGGPDLLSDARNQFWHEDVEGMKGSGGSNSIQRFGHELAVGDFNADGVDDLAISGRDEISGFAYAGAVHVLYGVFGVGLTVAHDQLWSQDSRGIKGTASESEEFGASLASGDFDGDGFADLAVGCPGEAPAGELSYGSVHVLYGGLTGLSDDRDQVLAQGVGTIKNRAESFDDFGSDVAAGDFDGDGVDDLAISAPGEAVEKMNGVTYEEGVVHVLFGSFGAGVTDLGNQLWLQADLDNPDVTPPEIYGRLGFGEKLVTGDFDADGTDDLVVWARWREEAGVSSPGVVHVLFGEAGTGLTRLGNQYWHQDQPGISDAAAGFDSFGQTLAVGDYDGNGTADLAIGVPQEETGAAKEGAVHVLSGVEGVGLTAIGEQFWTNGSVGILTSLAGFGTQLTAGDFDGDGRDDLAVGGPDTEENHESSAGILGVLPGSASGGVTTDGYQQWSQDS